MANVLLNQTQINALGSGNAVKLVDGNTSSDHGTFTAVNINTFDLDSAYVIDEIRVYIHALDGDSGRTLSAYGGNAVDGDGNVTGGALLGLINPTSIGTWPINVVDTTAYRYLQFEYSSADTEGALDVYEIEADNVVAASTSTTSGAAAMLLRRRSQ